jgi:hypothetical protein
MWLYKSYLKKEKNRQVYKNKKRGAKATRLINKERRKE